LSAAQQAILLAMGLQRKNVDALERELGLGASQALALFGKVIRRIVKALEDIRKEGVNKEIPDDRDQATALNGQGRAGQQGASFEALDETVEQELKSGAKEVSEEQRRQREMQKEILGGLDLRQ
jgi:N-acetyltransferase 10